LWDELGLLSDDFFYPRRGLLRGGDLFDGDGDDPAAEAAEEDVEEDALVPAVLKYSGAARVRSPLELRNLAPGGGDYPGIGLLKVKDTENPHLFRWRGIYKHSFPEELADAVPKKLLQATHSAPWTNIFEARDALEQVITWLWDKHEKLTDEKRPASVTEAVAAGGWLKATEFYTDE